MFLLTLKGKIMSSKNNGMGFPVVSDVLSNVVKKFSKKRGLVPEVSADLFSDASQLHVSYNRNQNFTTAILTAKNGGVIVGVAKRNPIDHDSALRGRSLALSRAFNNYLTEIFP